MTDMIIAAEEYPVSPFPLWSVGATKNKHSARREEEIHEKQRFFRSKLPQSPKNP